MLRRPTIPTLLLVVLATVGGCTEPSPSPSPDPTETVAEVRAARQAVAEPAVALHVAAQRVLATLEELRASEVDDPEARLALLDEAPSGPLEELEEAIVTVRGVELDGSSGAVADAGAALADAADAAEDALRAARVDLREQERAASVHASLLGMAARWDEPGSRSQQLDRLAALAEEADALAVRLASAQPVAPCLTLFERRAAAARHVADATRELRDHVEAYRGSEFDRRRDELAEDPFALEHPLVEADVAELDCWREQAPVAGAVAGITSALDRLEDALNPPGVSS